MTRCNTAILAGLSFGTLARSRAIVKVGFIASPAGASDRASGSRLYDEDGRPYLDFFTGAGTLNYGHNNPLLKQPLIEYFSDDRVIHSLDMFTVAKAEGEERFGNAGRQGDDAADRLRNAHRAPRFIRYFTGSRSGCIVSRHGTKWFDARAGKQLVGLALTRGHLFLTKVEAPLLVTGKLARPTLGKPFADTLEVRVNLGRVVAAQHQVKAALHRHRRA